MKIRELFDDWTRYTEKRFADRQWLLAKWESCEGVTWPQEKIDALLKAVLGGLDLRPGHSLADLGCGGGWILERISAEAGWAVGLDFSRGMLENAAALVGRDRLVQGVIGGLPFKDGSFDRVLCYFVLINMLDDTEVERSLLDMLRVVRKGGRVLVGQLPDRNGSLDYERAKAEYAAFYRTEYGSGRDLRDTVRMPQKLFDVSALRRFLDGRKIRYELRDSFNPFWHPGAPETVGWRFDLILFKD